MKKTILSLIGCFLALFGNNMLCAEMPVTEPAIAIAFDRPNSFYPYPKVYLHLSSFPTNEKIICSISRPIFGRENQLLQFELNEQGKIIYPDNREEEAIELSALGFLKGERVIASFRTLEGKEIASASFIPCRLAHEIPGTKLAISAELVTIRSISHYTLSIEGIHDGEKFFFQTKSGNEFHKQELVGGQFQEFGYTPDVLGSLGGIGEVSIITDRGTLFLNLPWGYRLFEVPTKRYGSKSLP